MEVQIDVFLFVVINFEGKKRVCVCVGVCVDFMHGFAGTLAVIEIVPISTYFDIGKTVF